MGTERVIELADAYAAMLVEALGLDPSTHDAVSGTLLSFLSDVGGVIEHERSAELVSASAGCDAPAAGA